MAQIDTPKNSTPYKISTKKIQESTVQKTHKNILINIVELLLSLKIFKFTQK
jgi:hypothetical protein